MEVTNKMYNLDLNVAYVKMGNNNTLLVLFQLSCPLSHLLPTR